MFKKVRLKQDFPEMEKKWLKDWSEKGTIKKYLQKNNSSNKNFRFLDGPITANNPMGVHHAWGRTYKDLWQKFFNLLGYKQRFQSGFDCQGLWVEVEVEKELGFKNKKDIENIVQGDEKASVAKFVDLCKKRVRNFSNIQTEQSKRLGYFMDWENSYYTMSNENNYMIWYFLKKCYENGWIYKGHDSVPWCPRCETAISQHEMLTEDYKEITHKSVFFKLPVKDRNFSLLVWTTTPWTVPANVAVGVNKKFKYKLWKNLETKENLIILSKDENGNCPKRIENNKEISLEEYVFTKAELHKFKPDKEISGQDLIGLKYQGPYDDLPRVKKAEKENPKTFHSVVDGSEIVVAKEGTGLLHVAPGAGQEDFKLGKKENLPLIEVIKDNAYYFDGLGEFSNKNAKEHPEIILKDLRLKENNKYYFRTQKYKHRYPVCWRCKAELVWKVADEWYIAMDKPSKSKAKNQKTNNNKTLRERMIEVTKKIRWVPKFGLDRELDWLNHMDDWLISKKNRYWGLALPIWECNKCGHFRVVGSYEELKNKAVEGWDEFKGKSPHKPYIDQVKIKCSKCNGLAERVLDVGNPWLDAGIVSFSTLVDSKTKKVSYLTDKKYFKKWFPFDFITESFPGQFKNWFYSLIVMTTVLENSNSYKTVLGFATLLAEDGRPMHKSWGNSIEFNEGADKIGVDVMRWMYCRQNPTDNLLFGYKRADEVRRQFYLRLWNIYRFFIEYTCLDKLKKEDLKFKSNDLKNVLDTWILQRFNWVSSYVKTKLKDYDIQSSALEIEKFVEDLSTWFLRRSRKRVWVHSKNQDDKKDFYRTLYYILTNLSIVLSPFLPFITEEIYVNLTGKESVHLSQWPTELSLPFDNKLIKDMELVRRIVEVGHRVRKELKIKVRQPLAKAEIVINDKFLHSSYLKDYLFLIKEELNIKHIDIREKPSGEKISIVYDTHLTKELKIEGELRELIRKIQFKRKELGMKPDEKIKLTVPEKFKDYTDMFKEIVLTEKISFGNSVSIEK